MVIRPEDGERGFRFFLQAGFLGGGAWGIPPWFLCRAVAGLESHHFAAHEGFHPPKFHRPDVAFGFAGEVQDRAGSDIHGRVPGFANGNIGVYHLARQNPALVLSLAFEEDVVFENDFGIGGLFLVRIFFPLYSYITVR